MAFMAGITARFSQAKRRRRDLVKDSDQALNYTDERNNINRRLRQLKLEEIIALAKTSSAIVLLGTGIVLLASRKFRLGSMAVVGFVLQTALGGQRRDSEEIELERYALKAERGDYGKLEVIPFK